MRIAFKGKWQDRGAASVNTVQTRTPAGCQQDGVERLVEDLIEEVQAVVLDPEFPDRTIQIGVSLPEDVKSKIVELLYEFKDVFAWSPEDMTGVPPHLMTHKLNIDPKVKPVKQKKRTFAPATNPPKMVLMTPVICRLSVLGNTCCWGGGGKIDVLRSPPPLIAPPHKRNRDLYLWCLYHNDHGHDTEDCNDLKKEVEDCLKNGMLLQYIQRVTSNLGR